ncbi:phosphoribosylanthranilate isomerase [Cyanobacterium stanieri LEGE 03274]|uniref:N-(5'-phosphoribosyl)anthranilate isomerase n=1 Tax=Cyanobacterium stanieri LEGE 03274 TaxID=1828756 RepID=A0ABR9V1H1_9CHRO|nr:phosphoribosylanthranilate isomerase [Cyanobacterium stanieri]MBE9221732.1 phosphoribosylanthranilate isomerase [Cyanobacterium stanieri LEGE 03274]
MRIKICGLTNVEEARAIASMGVDTIGFICVKDSPRYIPPFSIRAIVEKLPPQISTIGVFVNASVSKIVDIVRETRLTGVQLHGEEDIAFCEQLRIILPSIEIIKAIRYKDAQSRQEAEKYIPVVDTLLIDTYQKGIHGGTGTTFNWDELRDYRPSRPWLVAGGVSPDNVITAFNTLQCDGIDLSSKVEVKPGQKDLEKIKQLIIKLESIKNKLPN